MIGSRSSAGPNLAREIAQRQPAASVVACSAPTVAERLQAACHTPYFRPYTNVDVVGCELGGAVKNVIALAVGMADGMGSATTRKASAHHPRPGRDGPAGRRARRRPDDLRRARRAGRPGGDLLVAAVAQPHLRREPGPGHDPRGGRGDHQARPPRASSPASRCSIWPAGTAWTCRSPRPSSRWCTMGAARGRRQEMLMSRSAQRRGAARALTGRCCRVASTRWTVPRARSRRKPRVAVVFGGRSSEHAISCVTAGSVLAAIDRTSTTSCRSASPPTVAGCSPPTSRRTGHHRAIGCRASTRHGTAVVLAGDPTTRRADRARAGIGAQGVRLRRRGAAPAARSVRRGRHAPGPSGACRCSVRRLGRAVERGLHGQGVHEGGAGRRRAAHGPYVVVRPRDWESDPARGPARIVAALGYPVFVKPARGGSSSASPR